MGVKQVGKPNVTQNYETKGFLKPDGNGRLSGVITMYPGRPELLSGLDVTLEVKPYVTQCAFAPATVSGTVKPALDR